MKTIITALVKTAWKNTNTMEVNGIVLQSVGTAFVAMPIILGEFGPLTLHGAN